MTTHSITSTQTAERARPAMVPDSQHRMATYKLLLGLALPLTLAAGCASGPSRSVATLPFAEVPVPSVAADSSRQRANVLLGREIMDMWTVDKQLDRTDSVSVSVNKGVVTLSGDLPAGAERERIISRIRELPGVTHITGELDAVSPVVAAENGR